jgi:nitrogen regulatory protein PII
MNKVEAIIRPEKMNDVKDALAAVGLIGLNVVNVTGRGAQRGVTAGGSRGVGRYEIDMLPKVKWELVVHDNDTQKAIDTIIEHSRTGNIGDGKIFVYPVSNAIKVRTGEQGDASL